MSTGGLEALGAGGALAAANALSCPAESYSNDPMLEIAWAAKAFEFSEIHYNLISSAEPEFLHLTEQDDEIYNEFRRSFPTMMIAILNPEDLKSESSKKITRPRPQYHTDSKSRICPVLRRSATMCLHGLFSSPLKRPSPRQPEFIPETRYDALQFHHQKWRAFCLLFDGKLAEFNFGTLLRLNATDEYSEENTIFATRIQFYAIEIARNREGHNTPLWTKTTEASKDGGTTTLSDDVQRSV